ncbi:hypothetical protein [Micromonospora sp. DPT]|uniref:hypothetical protein n=1 Tax=Micromonospora sp. DPT TaxID=3142975 RepID=UPI00320804A4
MDQLAAVPPGGCATRASTTTYGTAASTAGGHNERVNGACVTVEDPHRVYRYRQHDHHEADDTADHGVDNPRPFKVLLGRSKGREQHRRTAGLPNRCPLRRQGRRPVSAQHIVSDRPGQRCGESSLHRDHQGDFPLLQPHSTRLATSTPRPSGSDLHMLSTTIDP